MELAAECYSATRGFPREEAFGMTSQIRRSAASVPANIAEGYGRDHPGSYIQSLRIAQGSLKELETHILLSQRVGLLEASSMTQLLTRAEAVGKMLRSLIRSLQQSDRVTIQRLPTAETRLPRRSRS
ncbi:MAG: four helix bundle protein [Rhizobiales bacterium]|nr:four helix bundle protein [Hyphomicrobiales bacterium]